MIQAVIFDLDGTLVQTEPIKAESYGKASVELCPSCASEQEVTNAFKGLVGRSREEVSKALMERFGLEDAARKKMSEMGEKEAWEALAETRMHIYRKMLEDPEMLRSHQLRHNIDLLHTVRRMEYKTALATTSIRVETCRVLEILGIEDQFDLIVTADDVTHTKPDPEIYNLAVNKLGFKAKECLAIEDSPPGVQAALAAEVNCIAVTTNFTRDAIHASDLLDERWIVDDPNKIFVAFRKMIEERARDD